MKIYRWKKKENTGGHTFRWQGKIVKTKPGDVVECSMDALGAAVKKYDCLSEVVGGKHQPVSGDGPVTERQEQEWKALNEPTGLIIQPKGGGWFDVINPDNPGNPLNDKALRKEEAETLLNWLNESE